MLASSSAKISPEEGTIPFTDLEQPHEEEGEEDITLSPRLLLDSSKPQHYTLPIDQQIYQAVEEQDEGDVETDSPQYVHKHMGSSSTSTKVSFDLPPSTHHHHKPSREIRDSTSGKYKKIPFTIPDNFTASQRENMLCSREQLLDDSYILSFQLTKLFHQLQEETDENALTIQKIAECSKHEKQVLAMYCYYHSLRIHPTSQQLHDMLTNTTFIDLQMKSFMSFVPNYRESVEITSLSTLSRCYYIPFPHFCLGLLIQAVQFIAYMAIIFFYLAQEKTELNRLKLAAIIFASVSLTMAGISNFTPMLLVRHAKKIFDHLPVPTEAFYSGKHALMKQQSRISYNLTHKQHLSKILSNILTFFETVNLFAILAATYILIPTLAGPFGIILNATVLFLVHQLDEQVFSVLKLKLQDMYYIDNPIQEEYVIRYYRIREGSLVLTIVSLVVIVSLYQ